MAKRIRRYRRGNKQDTAWGFLILGLIGIFWNDLTAGKPYAIILTVLIVFWSDGSPSGSSFVSNTNS
jgi:hypothetical protein